MSHSERQGEERRSKKMGIKGPRREREEKREGNAGEMGNIHTEQQGSEE